MQDLTEKEKAVMRLVGQGLSNKAAGNKLGITEGTIKVHMRNILKKKGLKNRTELAKALQESVIETLSREVSDLRYENWVLRKKFEKDRIFGIPESREVKKTSLKESPSHD